MSQITPLSLMEEQDHLIFPKGQPVRIIRDKLAFKLTFPPVQPSDKLEIMAAPSPIQRICINSVSGSVDQIAAEIHRI